MLYYYNQLSQFHFSRFQSAPHVLIFVFASYLFSSCNYFVFLLKRCKKYNVPIEKIFNRTQREKFQWAIDMATCDYKFLDVDSDRSTNKLKAEESDDEDMIDDED